ncbi:uncharacterized protein [Dermacentor andersoni]|uniref:uncharacterized protein n=1 Tax=Dermacentor andersoni TaxID=34620 RepID=UPI003B3A7BA3
MAADDGSICVAIDGVATKLTPIVNDDGSHVWQENGYAYRTEGGTVMSVVFADQQPPTGTQSPAAAETAAQEAPAEVARGVPESDTTELWSESRTRFLISDYKEKKALLGKKGGFRTKKALWQALANAINKRFHCNVSPIQAENKWKSLERAYKRAKTKNNSSGHSRVNCSHEEELGEVLEREHHIAPPFLLAPGKVIQAEDLCTPSDTEASCNDEAGPSQQPQDDVLHKRRRRDTSINTLLDVFQEAKKDRAERFDKKMALLERLVTAVEAKATQVE